MDNKFTKGLILGGLLTAGAWIGLRSTKKGKQLTDDLQKDLIEITKELRKKLADFQDITKENFNEVVKAVVEQYGATKKLATDSKEVLVEALEEKWQDVEEDLQKKDHAKKK
jgi:gas vesicle protein